MIERKNQYAIDNSKQTLQAKLAKMQTEINTTVKASKHVKIVEIKEPVK